MADATCLSKGALRQAAPTKKLVWLVPPFQGEYHVQKTSGRPTWPALIGGRSAWLHKHAVRNVSAGDTRLSAIRRHTCGTNQP